MKIYDKNSRKTYLKLLQSRRLFDSDDLDVTVKSILKEVRTNGDRALLGFTERLDKVKLQNIRVPQSEIDSSLTEFPDSTRQILEAAIKNIRTFHENQREKSWTVEHENGVVLGQKISPIERIGVYVPGGKAFYPSSLLMNVIPAQVAGCSEIAVVTPPSKSDGKINPVVLAACKLLGVSEVYSVGGAQSIAALAFGTETIPPVDMIVGPGNQYVAKAKQLVFGFVKIDSIAGPSEVTIIADHSAVVDHLVIDLFSQAEHDENAAVTLITHEKNLAEKVLIRIPELLQNQPRKPIISASLERFGGIIITENLTDSFEVANQIAPEHLELAIENPMNYLDHVHHAGAIFPGHFSPEAVGDYFAGPNHVLPTCGTARFFSPLGVYDFIKRTSIVHYTEAELRETGEMIAQFADLEQLSAHAESLRIRLK